MLENWGRGWNVPPPAPIRSKTKKPKRIKKPLYYREIKRYCIEYRALVDYKTFK